MASAGRSSLATVDSELSTLLLGRHYSTDVEPEKIRLTSAAQ